MDIRKRDALSKPGKITGTGNKNISSILQRMVDRKIAKKIKWLKEKTDDAIKNVKNFLKLERQHKAIKEKTSCQNSLRNWWRKFLRTYEN